MDRDFEDRVQRRMMELAEEPFGTLETATCAKRLAWCADNLSGGARQWSPREAFELLFFSYMGLPRTDLPVREETGERIRWESRNPCPTLEACLRLGLDTRLVCREVYERPVQCFLSRLDPELRFERDYSLIRPHADHCLETIRRVRLGSASISTDILARSLEGLRTAADADTAARQAAVLVLLQDGPEGLQLLLIRRSERPDDPWSGHLALPGGRSGEGDASILDTALRETREEVGLDVGKGGRILGRLPTVFTLSARLPRMAIAPFVAWAPPDAEPRPDPAEVSAAFWLPLCGLLKQGRSATVSSRVDGRWREWPAWPTPHGPVWGITERILTDMFSLVG